MGKRQCSCIKVLKHMLCQGNFFFLFFCLFVILAQDVRVRTYSSFCSQAQMNVSYYGIIMAHTFVIAHAQVYLFSCNTDLYLNFLFFFCPCAGATIVPSVEWWRGRMSFLIPVLEHTNTWRSSMNAFHTVSTSLLHLLDKCNSGESKMC